MKLTKRIFALALVLVLALGLFACVQPPVDTTTKPAGNDGTTAGNNGTTAPQSNLPEYLKPGQFPLVEGEEITLTMAILCHDMTENPEETYQFQFIEEFVGIDVEVEQYFYDATLAESISLLFADGDLPDLMIGLGLNASQIVQYGMEGEQLLDMKPYINEENTPTLYAISQENPSYLRGLTTPDGAIYTLANYSPAGSAPGYNVWRMFYNWDLMKECGITAAPSTLDEFLTMLRTIKNKYPEMTPFGGNYARYNATYFIQNALGFNLSIGGGDQRSFETDIGLYNGEITLFSYDKTLLPKYLEFMHTMYTEGLMEQDYYTLEKDTCKAHIAAGQYAVFSEVPGLYCGPENTTGWWGVKPLTSETNDTAFWPASEGYGIGGFAISADTEYPELCVAFADLIMGDGAMNRMLNGEGPSVSKVDKYALGAVQEGWYYDHDTNSKIYKDFEKVKDQFEHQNYWVFKNVTCWKNGSFRVTWPGTYDENDELVVIPSMDMGYKSVEDGYAHHLELPGYTAPYDVNLQYQYALWNSQAQYITSELSPRNVFFDADTTARVADLKATLDTFASQAIAEFVTGRRELTEAGLNAYFAEMEALGADEYVQIYTEYWANVNG